MINIISLVPYRFLPGKLGGPKNISLFNKYMSRHSNLLCIGTKNNDASAAEGFPIVKALPNSTLRYIDPLLYFRVRKIIKKQNAGFLLLEHPYFGWLGILLKWTTGVKLIIKSHNIESERWKSLGKWWWPILAVYEKITHRIADFGFFITQEDMELATRKFRLSREKSIVIPFGIEWENLPEPAERQACRRILEQAHGIQPGETIFLFNGSLDYHPNLQAVINIIDGINPALSGANFRYKIIICGKGLPPEMNELKDFTDKNIIYAGFVDDILLYFKGADCFINPVTEPSGIKSKLVEALGANQRCISCRSGAAGIPAATAGKKLEIIEDNDWTAFARAMTEAYDHTDTPAAFFDFFNWNKIAERAVHFIGG